MSAPSQYQQYVDYLNKQDDTDYSCFWFYQKPLSVTYVDNNGYNNDLNLLVDDIINYSWVCSNQFNTGNVTSFNDSRQYHETPFMFPMPIKRIDIISSDGQGTPPYSYSDSITIPQTIILHTKRYYGGSVYEEHDCNYTKSVYSFNKWLWSHTSFADLISGTFTRSKSGTLTEVLEDLIMWYKNIDLYVDGDEWGRVSPVPAITSNGGGATHIAKVTGQLKDLSSNLSDILIVSGGGGGGLLVGDTDYSGKEAGGISGSGDNSADQSIGNAFGQGESGTGVSGGGSGLYGGYKGTSSKSGGAGSGYIGNSLLSNKKMVGYNVPTSDTESTKTESVNVYSASGEANKPKAGNGKAKIKGVRDAEWITAFDGEATTYVNGNFSVDGSQYTSSNTYYRQSGNKYEFDALYYYENQYAGVRNGYVELGGSLIPEGTIKLRVTMKIEAQIGAYGNGYWKFGFNGVTCSDQFMNGQYDNGQGAIKPTEGQIITETRAYILEGDFGGKQLKFEGTWYNWISRALTQIQKIEYYREY